MRNMAASKKRTRTLNYSSDDCHKIVDIVSKYTHILENKVADAVVWRDKSAAWDSIAAEFNSTSLEPRTSEQLRSKYEKMKADTRAVVGYKWLRTVDGSKPKPPKDAGLIKKIQGLIQLSAEGLPSMRDSDSVLTRPVLNTTDPDTSVDSVEETSDSDGELATVEFLEITDQSALQNQGPQSSEAAQSEVSLSTPAQLSDISCRSAEAVVGCSNWTYYPTEILTHPKQRSLTNKKQTYKTDNLEANSWTYRSRHTPILPKQDAAQSVSAAKQAKSELAALQKTLLEQEHSETRLERQELHKKQMQIQEAILENILTKRKELEIDVKIKAAMLESHQLDVELKTRDLVSRGTI